MNGILRTFGSAPVCPRGSLYANVTVVTLTLVAYVTGNKVKTNGFDNFL